MNRKLRLAYVVSHPIQYQVPLLRRVAQEPDIDLTVFFWSDHSVKGYKDSGFGVEVKWDIPLLGGYKHEFLPVIRPSSDVSFTQPINRGIFRALREGKFDAVWVHGYWNVNCLWTMLAAKILGIPVVERAEGTLIDHPRSALKLLIKRAFFFALRPFIHAVLPISTRNRQYWAHYFGESFPSFPVPYTVDNKFFQQRCLAAAPHREAFRAELGLEPGRPVILFASKLIERKCCIDLLEAFLAMEAANTPTRPYLLIVGDGDQRASLEQRVRESGSRNVIFLGFRNQTELVSFFDLCDVFVLPSIYEPFALIVNELMNASRAVVVSDQVGCQPDLVRDGVNGRVFPARDGVKLRQVLEDMVSDPAKCARMGEAGLQMINRWSYEEDIVGLRSALKRVARIPFNEV